MSLICLFFFVVSFLNSGSEANLEFTMENQDIPVCVDVFAVNDAVLEREEIFEVFIHSDDPAIKLVSNRTSLLIFDDDCKHLCYIKVT